MNWAFKWDIVDIFSSTTKASFFVLNAELFGKKEKIETSIFLFRLSVITSAPKIFLICSMSKRPSAHISLVFFELAIFPPKMPNSALLFNIALAKRPKKLIYTSRSLFLQLDLFITLLLILFYRLHLKNIFWKKMLFDALWLSRRCTKGSHK